MQKPMFSFLQPFDMVFMLLTELSPIINDIFPTVGIQVSTPKRDDLMRLLL